MFNNWEKDKKVAEVESQDVVALKQSITDEVMDAFLNGHEINKEGIKNQIVSTIEDVDVVMLDIRLDEYIKNMKETFAGMEIMKGFMKEHPEQKEKMIEDIKSSTDFLLKN